MARPIEASPALDAEDSAQLLADLDRGVGPEIMARRRAAARRFLEENDARVRLRHPGRRRILDD